MDDFQRDREERRRRHRERKERVLHTRISEQLAEDIRRVAEDLRVPVSNLVRNVLEEAFDAVETVTDNLGDLVDDVVEEAERARERIQQRRARSRRRRGDGPLREVRPADAPGTASETVEFPDVVGWQPLIFNQARSCADCGASIGIGDRAFAGIAASGLSPHVLCSACMDARR